MFPDADYAARLDRARKLMADDGVDVMLLSVGADMPYFTGYEATPLERLTMLVVPRDGAATMVVPRLEAPRTSRHDCVGRPATTRSSSPTRPGRGSLPGGSASRSGRCH